MLQLSKIILIFVPSLRENGDIHRGERLRMTGDRYHCHKIDEKCQCTYYINNPDNA